MGPPILPKEGLFLTWHFSLFSSLFNRLKRSKRRTFNPELASLFIIPYDLGLDGYLNQKNCQNSRKCTEGHPEKVQNIVLKLPYFERNNGKDHAVLWSLGQYHPWPSNRCDLFMRNFCEKCVFTCYWSDPTLIDNRFISIPFPSGYHWWDGIEDVPWELGSESGINSTVVNINDNNSNNVNKNSVNMNSKDNNINSGSNKNTDSSQNKNIDSSNSNNNINNNNINSKNNYIRNLTAVYLGSTQTINPAHTKIRRAMTTQCNASSECHWKQIAHSSVDSNIADLLSVYRRSVFCLCPPGDDPARKGKNK